jgi:hypothetical protein
MTGNITEIPTIDPRNRHLHLGVERQLIKSGPSAGRFGSVSGPLQERRSIPEIGDYLWKSRSKTIGIMTPGHASG